MNRRCPECRHKRHGWRCQTDACECQRRGDGGSKNFPPYGTAPTASVHRGVRAAAGDRWPGRP